MNLTIDTVILLLAFAACFVLQIFLSRRKSRVFSWILPVCTFLYSIFAVLTLARLPDQSTKEFVGTVVVTFLISNTPTLLLFGVAASGRDALRRKRAAAAAPADET